MSGSDGRPSLLFLTQALPHPLSDGGNIRSYHVLRALSRRYAVTLAGTTREPVEMARPEHPLRRLCAELVAVPEAKDGSPRFYGRALFEALRGRPAQIAYNFSPALAAELRGRLGRPFDVVHLNHADAAQYATPPAGRRVLDTHNLLFDYHRKAAQRARGARRLLHRLASRQLLRFELAAFRACDLVLVCSEDERRRLVELGLGARSLVVPNGVDCAELAPRPVPPEPETLAFVGNLGYGPNADAVLFLVREVLPLLRRGRPGLRVLVVGKGAAPALRRAAALAGGVTLTGAVPDVRPPLSQAHAFVAPLRFGAGTRLKILEAFALGIPVVATRLGAEGIECVDGEHLLLADEPPALAAAVARLLDDPALAGRMAAAARALAELRYDWGGIGERMLGAYPA